MQKNCRAAARANATVPESLLPPVRELRAPKNPIGSKTLGGRSSQTTPAILLIEILGVLQVNTKPPAKFGVRASLRLGADFFFLPNWQVGV